MIKLNFPALAFSIASLISAQAQASEVQLENLKAAQPSATFSQTDIDKMFRQDAHPVQLAALSQQEMKETEGAWVPQTVGAIGGMTGYGFSCSYTRSCTAAGFGFAAFSGAISPIRGIWGFNTAIGLGVLQGTGGYYKLW